MHSVLNVLGYGEGIEGDGSLEAGDAAYVVVDVG